jgi:hypothetical protein
MIYSPHDATSKQRTMARRTISTLESYEYKIIVVEPIER